MNTIATEAKTENPTKTKLPRDVSIDYLRTAITILVIFSHSGMAYTNTAHLLVPNREYNLLIPIVDDNIHTSLFFDYFFAWADLFFMALMFFISALFAYPSLRRHGVKQFLRDRLLRIGLPLACTVAFILPLGLFASFQLHNPGASYSNFWLLMAKQHFYAGPPWFLWILMVFDFALAALYVVFNPLIQKFGPWLRSLKQKSASTALLLAIPCAISYALLQHRYGYGYDAWHTLITSPFSLQPARIGIYIVWCTAGFLVGSIKIEDGLLSTTGSLMRHWKSWFLLGLFSFNLLWLIQFSPAFQNTSPRLQHMLHAVIWAWAVSAMCFGALALFRVRMRTNLPWMDSLTRCAYCIYLVHFVFVLWTQRLLLPYQFSVVSKFMIGFSLSLSFSWLTALVLTRIPGMRRII